MIHLKNLIFSIQIVDDSSFNLSIDSPSTYDKVIQMDEDQEYSSTSQHAIKVFKDEKLIQSAIILASNGKTGVYNGTALLNNMDLIIRCSNKVFNLALPELTINWFATVDPITCFSVFSYNDSYITHGELSISRISKYGKIMWSFSGEDIFLNLENEYNFQLHENHISIIDFGDRSYNIDYDGNEIVLN